MKLIRSDSIIAHNPREMKLRYMEKVCKTRLTFRTSYLEQSLSIISTLVSSEGFPPKESYKFR